MGPTATTKRKDVWTTLLQISVWHALAEGRLHHRPHRAHHHRHRDRRQCGQVLTVRERGGLPGQRRLHRPHHQVLRLRRLFRHSLLRSPVHRSENETPVPSHLLDSHQSRLQHQVPLRLVVSDWTSLEDWVSISYRCSTPPSPWWSSPSRRSATPPAAVLSTTMVLHQLTRLEEIFFNLCYHLPIIHAFQSSQNRYKWNLKKKKKRKFKKKKKKKKKS